MLTDGRQQYETDVWAGVGLSAASLCCRCPSLPSSLPSLVVIIFVIASIMANDTAERTTVAFSSTSIVTMTSVAFAWPNEVGFTIVHPRHRRTLSPIAAVKHQCSLFHHLD
jgi:hypothetical protein